MIASVVQQANVTIPECTQFLQNTRDHEFLFGQEVGEFINQVYKKGVELHTYVATNNHQKAAQVAEWFSGQITEARKVFGKYLDFRKP